MPVVYLMLCLVLPLLSLPSLAQSKDPRDLVVMLRVRHEGRSEDFGAGIVVSQTPRRTVIITADHVVRRGEERSEIAVEFNTLRDKRFAAIRAGSYSARQVGLDLAVLFVEDREVPRVIDEELTASVSPLSAQALNERRAVVVGYMKRQPWAQSLSGEVIVRSTPTEIVISSNAVDQGASGGAVFDAESQALLGMVVADADRKAVARPIALVLEQLKQWNLEVSLRHESVTERMAAENELNRMGPAMTVAALSQALLAADVRQLALYTTAAPALMMVEEALRARAPNSDTSVAQQYFSNARGSPAALDWFRRQIDRGLDRQLNVFNSYYGNEAIVNAAYRSNNEDAVALLLDAGASPHGYQHLDFLTLEDPRFLFPVAVLLKNETLSDDTKAVLVRRMLAKGAVIPRLFTNEEGYHGNVMGHVGEQREQLRLRHQMGLDLLPSSLTVCDAEPSPICRRASERFNGFDWCGFVAGLPKTLELDDSTYGKGAEFRDLRLMHLLSISQDTASFLALSQQTKFPEYAVVEINKAASTWSVLLHIKPHFLLGEADGPCGRDGNDPAAAANFCWRKIVLHQSAGARSYRTRAGVVYKAVNRCGPKT